MRRRLLVTTIWAAGGLALGCDSSKDAPKPSDLPAVPAPEIPAEPANAPQPESKLEEPAPIEQPDDTPPPPHPGPWLWVTRVSAGIYATPKKDSAQKLGYVKRGAKIPVLAEKVEGPDCSGGWLKLPSGGFVCSMIGTMDPKHTEARFPPRQPNIEDILPYTYVRNAHHGTPLYKSIPSRSKMCTYEPYACETKKEKEEKAAAEAAKQAEAAPSADTTAPPSSESNETAEAPRENSATEQALLAAAESLGEPPEATPPPELKPWEDEERLHQVTHDKLELKGDPFVARHMLKGFYVAVDKTIRWSGRAWYKTTKGLIAPADRMWQVKGSTFHGVEIDGEEITLPVGFVYGTKKSVVTYEIDENTLRMKPKGAAKKWEPLPLTGKTLKIQGKDYYELKNGTYILGSAIRKTTPNPRPPEIGEKERWLDVDISEQMLVAFEGDTPKYATLISSGRESKIKEKDHSTPRGMWRIREKHIVSTMDGDGTAAGDLPYSIEDVPYVMYYHQSYATHAAFWHQNYGSQMSHGCINLAPLDAKWVFYFAGPELHEGYAGAWSTKDRPGSYVVVHD